jgi:SNF2 family DNA or RNA helicase
MKKYGFLWVTLVLFIGSLAGHWTTAWFAYVEEQREHNEYPQVSEYLVEVSRDTLENWQSEFLQLIWQVAGLAYLLYIGSPQSKEGDDRKEEKMDEILRLLDPESAEQIIAELDAKYPRK